MGQDRHIAGNRQAEEKILQLRRRGVMRRFHQHIARISDRQHSSRLQSGNEIGRHVNVGAGGQPKRNSILIKGVLQIHNGFADAIALVVIEARQDMRCAGDHRNALSDGSLRHGQRFVQIACTIVNTG